MDTYQAIYDAVRSKIHNGDIGSAVEQALRDANFGHYVWQASERAAQAVEDAAGEYKRPSAVYRPVLSKDGDMWCALLGENIEVGVSGFGETPAKAMTEFDKAWNQN